MSATDQSLLQQWVRDRDAEAFRTLAMRHAGMVYNTSRRILRDPTDAEDVAQECFEALVRAGDKPGAYLGAWLHRVATNLSFTHIEAKRRRLGREDRFAEHASVAAEPYERDLYEHIDEAIAALPDKLRYPLVAHFLENETHDAIAESIGVSRQTVTYRIGQAVERVRTTLKRRGITLAAAAVTEFLRANSSEALPARLTANLGKLAVAGSSAASVGTTLAGLYGLVSLKAVIAAAGVVLMGGATVFALRSASDTTPPAASPAPTPATVAMAKAEPKADVEPVQRQTDAATTAPVPVASTPQSAADAVAPAPAKTSERGDGYAEVQSKLENLVSMEFENIRLAETLAFLSDSYDLNIALDPRVVLPPSLPDTPPPSVANEYVTDGMVPYLNVKDVSLGDALRAICRPLGLDFTVVNDIITVSSPALLDAEGLPRRNGCGDGHDPVLQKVMSLEFENVHISEILEFVSNSNDVNIVVDQRAVGSPNPMVGQVSTRPEQLEPPFVTTGLVRYINVKDVALSDGLTTLLRPLNLAYAVEDGIVWITTPDRIEQEPFIPLDTVRATPELAGAIDASQDFEFDKKPLADVLQSMAQSAKVSIMVDARNANVAEATVNDFKLKGIPLSTALAVLLREHDLACAVNGSDVVVTSPAHARDRLFGPLSPVVAQPSSSTPDTAAPPDASTPAPKAAAAEPAAPIGTGNPEAVYAQAQKSFTSEDYAAATKQFDAYLKQCPTCENAPHALFWKAKSLQGLEQYQAAVDEFERLRTTYPASTRVPYAMFHQAACLAKLGQADLADELLQDIIQKYPLTSAADQAKSEFKKRVAQ